jgi:hypothetical protein
VTHSSDSGAGPAEPDPNESPAPALTPDETATLSALLDGMFPADGLGPSALEIGVLDYLLDALAGVYRGAAPAYRRALAALDDLARREQGRPFAQLTNPRRDAIVARLDAGQLERSGIEGFAGFFDLVWRHLREGLFADPVHGGNRDMQGWRLIGFPGAQTGYTQEEQQVGTRIAREPRGVTERSLPADDRRKDP